MRIQQWINNKIAGIAQKLPTLVHNDPASFSCGYNTGYKHAMLDLDRFIEDNYNDIFYHCIWCKEGILFKMDGLETISIAKIQGEQQQEFFEAIRHFAKFRAIAGLPNGINPGEKALDLHVDMMQLYEDLFEVKDE